MSARVRRLAVLTGIVVAQIFAVEPHRVEEFGRMAAASFERYRAVSCLREAGILTTLDEPNNFPQLPVRTDGPFVVWLGVVEHDQALREGLSPALVQESRRLVASGLLRGTPELLVMDPASRSRLRWVP